MGYGNITQITTGTDNREYNISNDTIDLQSEGYTNMTTVTLKYHAEIDYEAYLY